MGSFDIVGSKEKAVAIVEVPEGADEKRIAEEIIRKHKNVKSVLKKISERRGEYRTREYELITGDGNTEVAHKEYGCLFKLDPQKVYFSPRELTERQRIAKQVKPKEKVMVMFGGIAVISVIIAKVQPEVDKIYSVELSPEANKYAIENVRINGVGHKVILIEGDVKKKCQTYYGKCDRVAMPLPLGSESFLDIAVNCLKKEGGIIHFYNWGESNNPFEKAESIIHETLTKLGRKYEIINKKKVLPYSPRKWKIILDLKII